MKAILVIDMPDEAKIEEYGITYVLYHLQGCGKSIQGVGASLRPLPQKLPPNELGNMSLYKSGWNNCLNEILGEEK